MARQPDSGLVENFLKRDGRLNRWRYFKRIMLLAFVEMIILIVISVASVNMIGELSPRGLVTMNVFFVIWQLPLYCLMTRRLHDIGRDEKLAQVCFAINTALVIFFPQTNFSASAEQSPVELILMLVGSAIGLYALFCPGTKGTNQYGDDPLESN